MKHTIYHYGPTGRLLATRTTEDGILDPPLRVRPGDTILEALPGPFSPRRSFRVTAPHFIRRLHITDRSPK